MRLCYAVALSTLLLGPAAAMADEIGPAQAQALQQQLRDWLAGLLGPSVTLPEPPWQVRADHDHYVITWPVLGLTTPSGEPAITAKLRPLDGNRWSVDSITVPASGSFSLTLPQAESPVRTQFDIRHQDTHGVLDPTFNSRSQLHSELSDVSLKSEGAKQTQEQRFDRHRMDASLTPIQNGRFDLVVDGTTEGWNSASQVKGSSPIAVGIGSLHAVAQVNGINRDRVASLLAATGGVIGAWPTDLPKSDKPDLSPALRKQARLVVDALQDMLTSVTLQETLDRVQVEMAGVGGMSIRRFLLGMGGEAPDGRLHAWMDLALDDLASPSLPPKIAAYLPHHVEIKPSLSGVLLADLHRLALDATEDDMANDRFSPDLDAIFAHGGLRLGLETLSFDLGSAKLDGSGEVTVVSPDTWHGAAHLVATGFDDLTGQARNSPELQSALPALIMLRGLAKQDGDRLVWDVVSDGPKITVNGLDLSQLAGSDKPKAKSPAQKPGQRPSR